MSRRILAICFALLPGAIACHDHDDDHGAYATYQECFDEHTTVETLPVEQAIVICCLDHPIAGMTQPVCGNDTAACSTYLATNLGSASATSTQISAACQDYVTQKNM